MTRISARTFFLTGLAILAFAGNSILTRLALAGGLIGPADFLGLRLGAGAAVLAILSPRARPGWADGPGVAALLVYAAAFTFAYVKLSASTGALILFGCVQISMTALSAWRGAAPGGWELAGVAVAFGGLARLLAPGAAAPAPDAALLMALAGAAWGVYSLLGRGGADPLARTARNFLGAAPFGLLAMALGPHEPLQGMGVALALASGAVTSALGYVVWYAALPSLGVATAGAAQLLAPVAAILGGALWIGEANSGRLALGAALVLGGAAMTLIRPKRD